MPIHLLTDYLSLAVGFQLYLKLNKSSSLSGNEKLGYIIGALLGALIGSRLLAFLADPALYESGSVAVILLQNKTIIGGVLGGIIGIEFVKKLLGITQRTGDGTVIPLMIAIAIGRIGCELTGVSDGTIGGPCSFPWCFAQGDGIPRHPLPLYEIAALFAALPFVWRAYTRKIFHEGTLFRIFIIGYFSLRFALEFLKDGQMTLFFLSVIQWACLATIGFYLYDVRRRPFLRERGVNEPRTGSR